MGIQQAHPQLPAARLTVATLAPIVSLLGFPAGGATLELGFFPNHTTLPTAPAEGTRMPPISRRREILESVGIKWGLQLDSMVKMWFSWLKHCGFGGLNLPHVSKARRIPARNASVTILCPNAVLSSIESPRDKLINYRMRRAGELGDTRSGERGDDSLIDEDLSEGRVHIAPRLSERDHAPHRKDSNGDDGGLHGTLDVGDAEAGEGYSALRRSLQLPPRIRAQL
ncbi:hypothetical protein B0H14DRAFT_2585507 [Mycena olivaceomarginata]|nr:hypothetical protein B0H14DRAFT_2585507 [Mycena olivaceomarginata]